MDPTEPRSLLGTLLVRVVLATETMTRAIERLAEGADEETRRRIAEHMRATGAGLREVLDALPNGDDAPKG